MYTDLAVCPICGSDKFIKITGKKICQLCGAILSVDTSTIYVSRGGPWKEVLFLSPRMRKHLKLLNDLYEAFNLPENIIEESKKLLYKLLYRYKGRTHPFVTVSTILIYVARKKGYVVTYHDLEEFFINKYGYSLDRNKVIKMIEILKKYRIISSYKHPDYLISTNVYLNRLINELNLYRKDDTYYEKIWNIVTKLSEEIKSYFQGKNPRTVAAVLIYLAEMWLSNIENRRTYFTQKKLSKMLGISRFTLRERIRELYSYKGEYLDIVINSIKRRN